MFKKKKKPLAIPPSWLIRLEHLDRSQWGINREIEDLRQKISLITLVEADLKKMDVLTSMMSELARRVDLAGIADLPNTCVCESCGCNK